ncbi:hypothetical protein ARR68_15110, partial [Listeria monocytogenes]|nr:hypothetical protein [Listeria monocytogenes]
MIGSRSQFLLKKARAKAKMIEYNIPKQDHIEVEADVPKLFLIAISAIGNIANDIIQEPDDSINIIKKEN